MFFDALQANLILGLGVVSSLVTVYFGSRNDKEFTIGNGIVAFLVLCLNFFLLAFNANCLVNGQCDVWAWITTVFTLLIPIIIIFGGIASIGAKDTTA